MGGAFDGSPALDAVDDADLVVQLTQLARSRGALRFVLSQLAVAFVDGRRWEALGYVRVGDHARERLGLSGRSLHDLARVGRALTELPGLKAALVGGILPWSKVRLLARFVRPENERRWIAWARRQSVHQLERRVRRVDRGMLDLEESAVPGEPQELLRLRVGSSACFLWQHTRRWAPRVAGERVSPGTVLEMVTAETLSALPSGALAGEPEEGAPARRPLAKVCAIHADEPVEDELVAAAPPEPAPLPAFLERLLQGLETASALALDARLCRAVRLEQRLDAEIAPLLRQGVSRQELGLSPRKARALLRLERAGDACPALREAFRDGALSWVQAQILVPLLLGPAPGSWCGAWIRFAHQVTVRRLDEVVGEALALQQADPAQWAICRGTPAQRQTCARSRDLFTGLSLRMTAPRDVARLFRAVLCALRRVLEAETGHLPTEGEAFKAMLEHALGAWGVGAKTFKRFKVFARDGWRCTVPGCTSYRNLHAHHIRFRSAGGSDALANQTTLCAAHHLRGVHAGIVRIRGRAPDGLTFELPIATYRSGDVYASCSGT